MAGTCAIVVCDHGLGHVRRCALMAKERERTGEQVTLFAPRSSVERLQRAVPSITGLTVNDFSTQTTPERVRGGLPGVIQWLDRLPDLDGFDTLICDNLPEILARRPDAMISAQFFWHDVIEGASKDYANYCDELLDRYQPTVFGCGLFAMDSVRNLRGFIPTSPYIVPEIAKAADSSSKNCKKDLLITGGTTEAMAFELRNLVSELASTGPGRYGLVHVEPKLCPKKLPSWMTHADFSARMYLSLSSAVCRPGLGVITDLMTVGAEIFPIYEESNAEMRHNLKVLESLKYPIGDYRQIVYQTNTNRVY